jgi:hypothetical protein
MDSIGDLHPVIRRAPLYIEAILRKSFASFAPLRFKLADFRPEPTSKRATTDMTTGQRGDP